MRDIALVPEGDVLESGLAVASKQTCETDDLLAADWIPLVRHRRRALLAFREGLFDFADFRLLQAANLEGKLFERCSCDRQCRQEFGMPIALDHLGGNRRRLQPQSTADIRLD